MKKVMMFVAIVAALVSCQSKGNQNNGVMEEGAMTVVGNDSSAVAVYEGILPAADGPGIQYVLSVDSVGPDGEEVNKKKKTAYQLTPDNGEAPVYFVVVNDTTLRLVNDSLQEAVSDLNYDIIQVK